MTTTIDSDDPRAVAAVDAIHRGDTVRLRTLLAEHPELAAAALGTTGPGGMTRSLLHVATDWPAHHPNVAATIAALVEVGADIEATGAVIGDGTPLDDAVAFAQWQAAPRLLERGAHTTPAHA